MLLLKVVAHHASMPLGTSVRVCLLIDEEGHINTCGWTRFNLPILLVSQSECICKAYEVAAECKAYKPYAIGRLSAGSAFVSD